MITVTPYNNRIKVVPLSQKKKTENDFEIPSQLRKKEDRHHDEKYLNVKIIDISNDINLIKDFWFQYGEGSQPTKSTYFDSPVGKGAVIETFALEEVSINGEIHYFVPFQSIICVFDLEKEK